MFGTEEDQLMVRYLDNPKCCERCGNPDLRVNWGEVPFLSCRMKWDAGKPRPRRPWLCMPCIRLAQADPLDTPWPSAEEVAAWAARYQERLFHYSKKGKGDIPGPSVV